MAELRASGEIPLVAPGASTAFRSPASASTPSEVPWVGPRPYEEKEYRSFFGRGAEIKAVRDRILVDRVTFVRGRSGSGKTSLLRAGVLPSLRLLRARSTPAGEPGCLPALILRGWSELGRTKETLFQRVLLEAEEEYNEFLPSDPTRPFDPLLERRPKEGGGEGSFFEEVERICALTGGVILIFDQFEELVRRSSQWRDWANEEIIRLFRSPLQIRIVISTREEYYKDLRPIEVAVGGIAPRTYFLEPMREAAARDALIQSAAQAGVDVTDEAMRTLLQWVSEFRRDTDIPVSLGDETFQPTEKAANLLLIQTLLVQAYEFLRARSRSGRLRIDLPALRDFRRVPGRREPRTIPDLVGGALERWISESLSCAPPPQPPARVKGEFFTGRPPDPEVLSGVVRRIAARLAPHLSAGGFKVAQPEATLIRWALRGELEGFGDVVNREVEEQLKTPAFDPAQMDFEILEIDVKPDRRSGPARTEGWQGDQTVRQLFIAYDQSIRRLVCRNVLNRYTGVEGGSMVELVHDGFGQAFTDWGEAETADWQDRLYSLAPLQGDTIRIPGIAGREGSPRVIRNLRYLGGAIKPEADLESDLLRSRVEHLIAAGSEGSRRVDIADVLFQDCDLTGTIFENIDFHDTTFDRCVLNGVIFLNCNFQSRKTSHFAFRNCTGTMTTFLRGSAFALRFLGCRLTQASFARVAAHTLVFQDCRLLQSRWRQIAYERAPQGHPIRMDPDCNLEYCLWDDESRDAIDFGGARVENSGTTQLEIMPAPPVPPVAGPAAPSRPEGKPGIG